MRPVVASSRPPSSSPRIFEPQPSRAAHFENTHFETIARHEQAPVDATPGDLPRVNVSHPVEPRSSRLLSSARDLCDGEARPPIQELPPARRT
jgi:hypothetical protein